MSPPRRSRKAARQPRITASRGPRPRRRRSLLRWMIRRFRRAAAVVALRFREASVRQQQLVLPLHYHLPTRWTSCSRGVTAAHPPPPRRFTRRPARARECSPTTGRIRGSKEPPACLRGARAARLSTRRRWSRRAARRTRTSCSRARTTRTTAGGSWAWSRVEPCPVTAGPGRGKTRRPMRQVRRVRQVKAQKLYRQQERHRQLQPS
mmetsp:Transcript_5206/g.13147  ORF Transcript_5206/g.13147 Transcript_5206/m.13147 type:complete len:207 (-) Transcript_5206:2849-3469(-)